MEVSRATSVTSTANQEHNSERKSATSRLENNGEAAATNGDRPLTSRSQKEDKSVESPSLEDSREEENGHNGRKGVVARLRDRMSETVTHEEATIPLAWQALLTGLVDALLYGKSTIWTGFQTGEFGYRKKGEVGTLLTHYTNFDRKHGSILSKHCTVHAPEC